MKRIITTGLLATMLTSLAPAWAADAPGQKPSSSQNATRLEEIVVTPTGKIGDEQQSKMPAVVETMTPEGIERINAVETSDVFKYMPGSYLRKLYPGSTNSPLVIRGNNTTQTARTLVVADGMPISDFTTAGNSNAPKWQMVMTDEIESVDVIYGPFSAAMGGNSMSGTAIIKTHMPTGPEASTDITYTHQDFKEYRTDTNLDGYTLNAYAGNKWKRVALGVWLQRLETEAQGTSYVNFLDSAGQAASGNTVTGWDSDKDGKGRLRYIAGAQGVQDIENTTLKAKLGFDLTDYSTLRLTAAFWDSDTQRDKPETYLRNAAGQPVYAGNVDINGKKYNLGNSSFSYSDGEKHDILYGLNYKYDKPDGLKLDADFSYYDTAKDLTQTSSSAAPAAKSGGAGTVQESDRGWYTADLKASHDVTRQGTHTLSAGYHFDTYFVDTEQWNASDWKHDVRTTLKQRDKGSTQNFAVFADDNWAINEQWTTYLGGRFETWKGRDASKETDTAGGRLKIDLPDRRENNFSPKFSTTFKPNEKWRLRFSVAQATRYPTVGELYQGGITSSGLDQKNNPDLKPEKSLAHDFTITRLIGSTGEARLTFFQDDIEDAIYSQTNTLTNVSSFQNVDEVRTRGIEVAYNQRHFLIDGLGLFANLAWTDSETLANAGVPASEGKKFPRVPTWRAKCVLDYSPSDKFCFTLAGHYSGQQYGELDNSDHSSNAYGDADKYLIFDTKVTYRYNQNFSASVGVDNLTNELYHITHPYPRRTFFVTLRSSF